MTERKIFLENTFLVLSFMFSALFITFLYISQYPLWWKWIVYEQVPLTWLESSILISCSLLCLVCFAAGFMKENAEWRKWLLMSVIFALLAFDERFAVHERLRDRLLAPAGIKLPLASWTAPGDFILLAVMMCGLLSLWIIIPLFKYRRKTLYFFLCAVVTAAIAIVIDSFDISSVPVSIQRYEQFAEEIIETAAMLMFLNSFFIRSLDFISEKN